MTDVLEPIKVEAGGGKVWSFSSQQFTSSPALSFKDSLKIRGFHLAISLCLFAILATIIVFLQEAALRAPVFTEDYVEVGSKAWVVGGVISSIILSLVATAYLIKAFFKNPKRAFFDSNAGVSAIIGSMVVTILLLVLPLGMDPYNVEYVPQMEKWTLSHLDISPDQVEYMNILDNDRNPPEVADGSTGVLELKDGTEITFGIHFENDRYSITSPRMQKFELWDK